MKDVEGQVRGNLLITLDLGTANDHTGKARRFVLAQCLLCNDSVKQYRMDLLNSGQKLHCGCANLKGYSHHGLKNTRQYRIWTHMKNRCNDPKNSSYEYYGARGITYDPKWEKFLGFWEDMSEFYSDKLELDRIDPNGNYNKENCRWENESIQSFNTRKAKNNTTGRTGISFDKKLNSFVAYIYFQNKRIHLGTFKNYNEAVNARSEAEIKYFGFNKQ